MLRLRETLWLQDFNLVMQQYIAIHVLFIQSHAPPPQTTLLSPLEVRHASERARADRIVVNAAVANDGLALEFAAEELRSDPSIAITAVASQPCALEYVPAELRENPEFVQQVLEAVASCILSF